MPAVHNNELMNTFCKRVLEGSLKKVHEIHKSNSISFDINYIVPDNIEGTKGLTALQIALWYHKYGIAQYLIYKCHADVNAQGADGVTALYVAISSYSKTWVNRLLKLGAKVNIEVDLDKQPLERLRHIFSCGLQYCDQEALVLIYQKLIEKGAAIAEINDDYVDFLIACNPILTLQSTPDLNNSDDEDFVTDDRMTGTVNFDNLIATMASVAPWVGVVASIGTLVGITGWSWSWVMSPID